MGRLPTLIIFTMRFTECLTSQKSGAIRLWHVKSCGKAVSDIQKGNKKLSQNWFYMPCIFRNPFVWEPLMILLCMILLGNMTLHLNLILWHLGSRFFYCKLIQPQLHSFFLPFTPTSNPFKSHNQNNLLLRCIKTTIQCLWAWFRGRC